MMQLDEKANNFLIELRQSQEISFETHNENYCGVSQQNNKAVIFYNPLTFSNSSIVHELLHVWLNKYDYFIGNHIYMMTLSHPKLSKVMTKFLCDYIENVFDHNKMYPKYHEMGYSDEDFIVDGLKEKCSIQDIKQLTLKFLNVYRAESINMYIGFLLSIYADHVIHDYSEHLKLLKAKDSELFRIVTEFWNRWLNFDVENIDSLYNSAFDITNPFIDEMEDWIKNKKIK
jgi:hypothetical protein